MCSDLPKMLSVLCESGMVGGEVPTCNQNVGASGGVPPASLQDKHPLLMASVTICSDFGAPQNKVSQLFSIVSPSICHEVMGPDAMIFVF